LAGLCQAKRWCSWAGFLAGRGVFDLDVLIVTIAAAAIIGDSIGYELGRHLGRNWLLRYGRWIGVSQSHLEKVDRYFQLHGGKSVFFSHFMHLLRGLMSFLAGSSRMRYPPFLFFNGLAVSCGQPCSRYRAIFAERAGRLSKNGPDELLPSSARCWAGRWVWRC
jgi:membrane protein DedA with SNARE-associated domain